MKYLLIFIICQALYAQNSNETPRIRVFNKNSSEKKKIFRVKTQNNNSILAKILKNNQKIDSLLGKINDDPVIWDGNKQILTGKTYRGKLLNSIVSTNLASPVLVLAYPNQGLPFGTKFSCQGVTQNRRVMTICGRMITPKKEVLVSAQILNTDGTAGLLGLYDDGKENLIAGAIISDFASGVLSAAQSKITTPFGAVNDSTLKKWFHKD